MRMSLRGGRSAVLTAFLAAAAAASGCSSDSDGLAREAISGTVTFDGQPLERGSISFIPDGQLPTQGGAPITDGKYSIAKNEGLVAGTYHVAITSPQGEGEKAKDDAAANAPGMLIKPPKELIPSQYNSKSTLTAEVKEGASNSFDFKLEKGTAKK